MTFSRGQWLEAVKLLAVFAAYVITARLGLLFDAVSGFATLVWPPTGIALFALVRWGRRLWPAIFAGALVANALTGAPVLVAMGIATGNTLEAVAGAYLLGRVGFEPALSRVRDVLALVLLGAVTSTLVSASLGVFSLWAGGLVPAGGLFETWRAWWIGDMLGDLVVGAFLLVWSTRPRVTAARSVLLEASVMVLLLLGWTTLLFANRPELDLLDRPFLVFPVLIWAALRFRQRGAVTSVLAVSALAIAATAFGYGAFVGTTLSGSLLVMQIFMGILAVTILLLAAAVAERDQAMEAMELGGRAAKIVAEVSTSLSESLDPESRLSRLSQALVPRLGDLCLVYLQEEGDPMPTLRAIASRGSSRLPTPADGETASLSAADAGVARVIRTGRAELHADLSTREAGALRATTLGQPPLTSAMVVPFTARGRTQGAMTLAVANRRYTLIDLRLAEEIADRVAYAVDNARLYVAAQGAVRARDDFLSVASHELRTPLTALQLQVDSLRKTSREGRTLTSEKLGSKTDKIARQVGRLGTLVDNLLDVSRALVGHFSLELEEVDLSQIVCDVGLRLQEELRRVGSELILRIESSCKGQWDRLRLEQIVTNLISNAAKYGGGQPIELDLHVEGSAAILCVRDHGIGISEQDQERIFERFERAVSPRHFGGLGLGLWIVRQIVQAMDGQVFVKSDPGRGAEFTVVLPTGPHSGPPAAVVRGRTSSEEVENVRTDADGCG